jgi:cyclase
MRFYSIFVREISGLPSINQVRPVIIPAAGMHSSTDVLVYLTKENVVHIGSLLISEAFPYISMGKADDYIEFLKKMLDVFPADTTFVSGHGPHLNRKEFEDYCDMVFDSAGIVIEHMKKGETPRQMHDARILEKWSQYEKCEYIPYLSARRWIATVYSSYVNK